VIDSFPMKGRKGHLPAFVHVCPSKRPAIYQATAKAR
jgi:hypothetical protein